MNARETCRHGNEFIHCRFCNTLSLTNPMEAWKNARRESRLSVLTPEELGWAEDDLLPTHPRFTVEDQIFLHRRCAIKL